MARDTNLHKKKEEEEYNSDDDEEGDYHDRKTTESDDDDDAFYDALDLSGSDDKVYDLTEELEGGITLNDGNFKEAMEDFEFLVVNFYSPYW